MASRKTRFVVSFLILTLAALLVGAATTGASGGARTNAGQVSTSASTVSSDPMLPASIAAANDQDWGWVVLLLLVLLLAGVIPPALRLRARRDK